MTLQPQKRKTRIGYPALAAYWRKFTECPNRKRATLLAVGVIVTPLLVGGTFLPFYWLTLPPPVYHRQPVLIGALPLPAPPAPPGALGRVGDASDLSSEARPEPPTPEPE